MDPTVYATKKALARTRVVELAGALASHHSLDPSFVEALTPPVKDPAIRELRLLEGLGDFLQALAQQGGVLPEDRAVAESSAPQGLEETVSLETNVTAETDEAPKKPRRRKSAE